MNRRLFLKMGGSAGLAAAARIPFSQHASAEPLAFDGPFFLHLHATGGWDTSMLCDAKTTAPGPVPAFQNNAVYQVGSVNGIAVPTFSDAKTPFLLQDEYGAPLEEPAHFFANAGRGFLVLNGVDMQTMTHETGIQVAHCGSKDLALPSLAALYAAKCAATHDLPLSYLGGGSYDVTAGLIGVSRWPGSLLSTVADPLGQSDPSGATLKQAMATGLTKLRSQRLARLESQMTLPLGKRALEQFKKASVGAEPLNRLSAIPAPDFEAMAEGFPALTRVYAKPSLPSLGAQLEPILRCFKAGVSAAATVSMGDFDNQHVFHDVRHNRAMGPFLAKIRYVLLRAEQLGIANKLFILVTSDFGRAPLYSGIGGKNHWNITSMLVHGPGIRGGRVIGKTDEALNPYRVVPTDVSKVVEDGNSAGVRLHPFHVHRELRRVLGIDQQPFAERFALNQPGPRLSLFA